MELDADQLTMLVALVEMYPNPSNQAVSGWSHEPLALRLKWTPQKTREVFDSLRKIGALRDIGGMLFLEPDWREPAIEELRRRDLQQQQKTHLAERRLGRREWRIGLISGCVGAILSAILTLRIAYLAHIWGWNK